MLSKISNDEELTKEEYLLDVYATCFCKNEGNSVEEELNKVESELKDNEEAGKDSFKYRSLIKQKELLESLPEKESIYLGDWKKVISFKFIDAMKILLLTVGIAGIFSKEYSSRVSYINLSSKNGKTKLNTAKIISVIIYSTIVFVFVTITTLISTFYLGLPNGDKPVSSIVNSIYNLSINEYYLGTLGFSYVGTLICGLIIMLTSLLTKKIIAGFIIPIVLYLLPQIIRFTGAIEYLWNHINFNQLFSGRNILAGYVDFNIFGGVVIYPYVMSFVAIISIIIITLAYNNFAKKQRID